jgi:toxin ParE1/3/4
MARVLQTPEVVDDLIAIGEFVAEESQSLKIALGLLDKIDQKCKLYASNPAMGTDRPDLGDGVQVFPVDSYVVIYRPTNGGIQVLMVVHGSRNIPPLFGRRMKGSNE